MIGTSGRDLPGIGPKSTLHYTYNTREAALGLSHKSQPANRPVKCGAERYHLSPPVLFPLLSKELGELCGAGGGLEPPAYLLPALPPPRRPE